MTEVHTATIYQHKGYAEDAVAAARDHADRVPDEVVGLFGEPPARGDVDLGWASVSE